MKKQDKQKLMQEAYDYCVEKDKSTEFMIEYIQSMASVSYEKAILFLKSKFQ